MSVSDTVFFLGAFEMSQKWQYFGIRAAALPLM